ncbi:MAG TPA: hypothetical protein VF511_11185, partial [Chthoniobacterales bacterium]
PQADPSRGSFRSYVLGSLKLFLANVRRDERAQKRDPGAPPVPLDEEVVREAEIESARRGDFHQPHPADRRWARDIEKRILSRLAEEYAAAGKSELYAEIQADLSADRDRLSYQEVASRLGRSVATVRSDTARLRRRYGELLLAELRKEASEHELKEMLVYYCRLLAEPA